MQAHEALQVMQVYDNYLEFGLILSAADNDMEIDSPKLDKKEMLSGLHM